MKNGIHNYIPQYKLKPPLLESHEQFIKFNGTLKI